MNSRDQFEACHEEAAAALIGLGKYEEARIWANYKNTHWEIWRAARGTISVELPKGESLARRMHGPQASGAVPLISRSDAVEAIEAAGLTVAP